MLEVARVRDCPVGRIGVSTSPAHHGSSRVMGCCPTDLGSLSNPEVGSSHRKWDVPPTGIWVRYSPEPRPHERDTTGARGVSTEIGASGGRGQFPARSVVHPKVS